MKKEDAIKSLEFYRNNYPKHVMFVYAEEHKIDLDHMAENKPVLYSFYSRIGNDLSKSGSFLWKNYSEAYKKLEEVDAFNRAKLLIGKKLKNITDEIFAKAYSDKCFVSVSDMQECVTEKKRRGKKSIEVEYNDLMKIISMQYNIEIDDVLCLYSHDIQKIKEEILELNYNDVAEEFPANSVDACRLILLSEYLSEEFELYLSFWHHMIETDFSDCHNDCTRIMFSDYEATDDMNSKIFVAIRHIIFKEIAQLPFFGNVKPKEIEFHIWW